MRQLHQRLLQQRQLQQRLQQRLQALLQVCSCCVTAAFFLLLRYCFFFGLPAAFLLPCLAALQGLQVCSCFFTAFFFSGCFFFHCCSTELQRLQWQQASVSSKPCERGTTALLWSPPPNTSRR